MQAILSREILTAQQCRLGLFLDSDFAGDLQDSKSTSERNVVHNRESNVCSNQLDVQETNRSFEGFCGIRGYFLRCRFAYVWCSRSRSLSFGDFEVLLSSCFHTRSSGDWSRNKHCEKQANERTKGQSEKSVHFGLAAEYVTPIAKLSRHDASLDIFFRQQSGDQRRSSDEATCLPQPQSGPGQRIRQTYPGLQNPKKNVSKREAHRQTF